MADGGALREILAVFGFEVETDKLEKGESSLKSFFESVKTLGEGLLTAFAVDKVYEFAEANVKAMTAIERTADQLGISTDEVQGWQYAAQSLGLEADALTNSMGRLQVSQQAAANGGKQQAKAFADIGVNVRDSNGHFKEADQLYADVAEGISKIKDPSKQAAVAVQLLGRSGRTQLPLLKKGAEGIDALLERYKALGGGYTEDAIAKAKEFEAAQADLGLVMTSVKSKISEFLLPVIKALTKVVLAAMIGFRELAKNSNIMQAALVVLGGVATYFAVQMLIAAAPVIAMAAAFLALVLIVDDLITLFEGGDSVIGEFIDKAFGKGASAELVEKIKGLWEGITATIKDGVAYIKEHWAYVQKLVSAAEFLAKINPIVLASKASGAIGDAAASGAGARADRRLLRERASGQDTAGQAATIDAQRLDAQKNGQIFIPKGETFDQAKAALATLNQQNTLTITIQGSADAATVDQMKKVAEDSIYGHFAAAAATRQRKAAQ